MLIIFASAERNYDKRLGQGISANTAPRFSLSCGEIVEMYRERYSSKKKKKRAGRTPGKGGLAHV
jgi:hypothetical protein